MTNDRFSPAERAMRARLAAHALHAQVDGKEHTAPARKAFADRFLRQVDPDNVLDPAERERRAEHARKAYFLALAVKSVAARRRRSNRGRSA